MWPLILIAVIQGLFEWLPISSQGQVVLILQSLLGINIAAALSISLWLHLGTMFSVLFYYRRDYISILKGDGETSHLLRKFLLLSTLMTGVVGVPVYIFLNDLFPVNLGDLLTLFMGLFLIVTGVIIYFTRNKYGSKEIGDLSYIDMLLVGVIQGFALLPGLSRSGVTIAAFLWLGFKNQNALKLSFLMSAPAVLGAVGMDAIVSPDIFASGIPLYIIILALILTALTGVLAIKYLTKLAQRINFSYFCIILGLLIILLIGPFLLFSGSLNILLYIEDGLLWLYNNLRNIVLIIGPAGLFFVMIIQAVVAPIPSEGILILAGGAFTLSYGFPAGVMVAVFSSGLGGICGALVSYTISRMGGRPIAKRLLSERTLSSADAWFYKYGGWAVLIGRLMPFIPFDAISYGAGLTKMKTSSFLSATIIGIFPRSFLYVYIGYLIEQSMSTGQVELLFLVIMTVLALAVLLIFLYRYYFRRRKAASPDLVDNAASTNLQAVTPTCSHRIRMALNYTS